MKTRLILTALVAAMIFAACGKEKEEENVNPNPNVNPDEEQPTQQEKEMVMTEMTWQLDSVLTIYNYQSDNEYSVMSRAEDGIDIWTYTFYPSTYRFPEDLFFISEFSADTFYIADQYNNNFCKYICCYNGRMIAAGNLCYYNGLFTFSGIQDGGWVEFRMREANTNWDNEVWTNAFNVAEEADGTVTERCIEYYSRIDRK